MIALLTTAALALTLSIGAPAPEPEDYEDALGQLGSAVGEFMSLEREHAIEELERSLAQVSEFPDGPLAGQPAPAVIIDAWVILAGLYLAERDLEAAKSAMDEAIRTARGQPLAVQSYGPKVSKLYQERFAALQAAGMAEISVDCDDACTVVINERLLSGTREQLLLGSYRVWVKRGDGEGGWKAYTIDLTSPDTVVVVPAPATQAGTASEPEAPVLPESETAPVDAPSVAAVTSVRAHERPSVSLPAPIREQPRPPQRRMIPRGVEIAGVTAGVGLMIIGGLLLSYDGKCEYDNRRPSATTSEGQCGDIYETSAAGGSLLGIGTAVLATATAFLTIDEIRIGRARSPRVMLGLTWQF